MNNSNLTVALAIYYLAHHSTIRETAKAFRISKSLTHTHLHHKLPNLDNQLFTKVQKLAKQNFQNKHLKGGNATKQKYKGS